MRDAAGLAGCVRGEPRGAFQIPRRAHRVSAGRPSGHHRHLTASPGSNGLDCAAWSIVGGPGIFEVRKNVFGALRRPECKQAVVVVSQRSASTNGDQPRIAFLGQNHIVSLTRSMRTVVVRDGP